MVLDERVTILIPTSPIPRHPDTALLEECVAHVRTYLPDASLIVMADGVRPQVEHRREQYREYLSRLDELDRFNRFGNALIRRFPDATQQATMTRTVLAEQVRTPLILFVEHDALLRETPRLDVEAIVEVLLSGDANVVRLYAWSSVWHEHAYLMRGELLRKGVRFTKTVQYSQWPLFSTADYHRKILDKYFVPNQRSMIESGLYGPVAGSQWDEHRIVIYGPDGHPGFIHHDGRTDPVTGRRDPGEW